MEKKINDILSNYATDDTNLTKTILRKLETSNDDIIEIIGESGCGKHYVCKDVAKSLKEQKRHYEVYIPSHFAKNHFKEVIQLVADIPDTKFFELITESQKYKFINRFDFFYFITEKIKEEKLIIPVDILIYRADYLGNYTIDFIHYFNQFSQNMKVQFVVFSPKRIFAFSTQFPILLPKLRDTKKILQTLFSEENSDFASESEIINKLTNRNLFQIENILRSVGKKKISSIVRQILAKKISHKSIVKTKYEELSVGSKKLLFAIFLLDNSTTKNNLIKLLDSKILEQNLDNLLKNKLIQKFEERYFINDVNVAKTQFSELPAKEQTNNFEKAFKLLKPALQPDFSLFFNPTKKYSTEYLQNICDFESYLNEQQKMLKIDKKNASRMELYLTIGVAYYHLQNHELAIENLREALKISQKISLSSDEIIYYLAKSLHLSGSDVFALEIIKKYTFASSDMFLKNQILLLKIEIKTDLEKNEEALKIIEEILQNLVEIKDKKLRKFIEAEAIKNKGKIYYSTDKWDKATDEFERSEEKFKEIENVEGLAAIYNNLGVLAMFRGDGASAETLMKKSLKFEKMRFNLNGVAICHSNLGYLSEEYGDYKKSLKNLSEALNIQKLLGDKYSIANIYINIGVTYMDNGEYEKAEKSLLESLRIAIKFKLYRNIIASQNNLGALYFKSGNFAEAIKFYKDAIRKSEEHNFYEGLGKSYNNLGEIYEKRGKYDLAHDFYLKGINFIDEMSDEILKAELKGNIGSALTKLHKFEEAYPYLVESLDFFKKLNAKDKIIEGLQKQSLYFIYTRNFESANYYLKSALSLSEEMENTFQIGKCYYLKSFLEHSDVEKALEYLRIASEAFSETKNSFELTLANFEYASLLLGNNEWEEALEVLLDNQKIISQFDAINVLEKNEALIHVIEKKYATELKESKTQESLLNEFYDITNELNKISDFDLLLETALKKMVDFAKADGGIFSLYPNSKVKNLWEYLILENFSNFDNSFSELMNIVEATFTKNEKQNEKQPHFAPEFKNIISFPLTVRNEKKGVICLFAKTRVHYFTEKMINLISALCNQVIVIVENIFYENLQKSQNLIRAELESTNSFSNIIGKSENIQKIFDMIDKVKNSSTTILLEGESGTGKELVARAIHFKSERKDKSFVAQYCGALPETLLESELFGHVKGAFTGATHNKKGLFEVANGGTFFLDEIADISLSIQAKLLRFLQEGEIKPVGSTQIKKVDVRVVCATNVSLKEKVERGEFRLDLYYRLNVIKFEVPSLRERISDIPLLAVHFLDKYNAKMKRNISGITAEAMKYLENYDWPGNIRQLENEIERAVTLSDENSSIKSSDLSEEVLHYYANKETTKILETVSLKDAIEDLERKMILDVFKSVGYNQTKAAKSLGLSRQGLIKKMQRYGIQNKLD